MPVIRSKGHDILVRYAGKRLRITMDWAPVPQDAMERILEAAANLIQIQPEPEKVEPVKSEPKPESKSYTKPKESKRKRKDKEGDE